MSYHKAVSQIAAEISIKNQYKVAKRWMRDVDKLPNLKEEYDEVMRKVSNRPVRERMYIQYLYELRQTESNSD